MAVLEHRALPIWQLHHRDGGVRTEPFRYRRTEAQPGWNQPNSEPDLAGQPKIQRSIPGCDPGNGTVGDHQGCVQHGRARAGRVRIAGTTEYLEPVDGSGRYEAFAD